MVDGGASSSQAALLGVELAELTDTELLVFAPEPERLARMLPQSIFVQILQRGRAVRILHGADQERDAPFTSLARAGARVVGVGHLQHTMMVRDREVLYAAYSAHPAYSAHLANPATGGPGAERLVRSRNVVVARCLAAMCDTICAAADESPAGPAQPEISFDQREILRVLSDGFTDNRAAARLHISTRTFARRVAIMMSSLGASSRFQAGVQAAKRGWI